MAYNKFQFKREIMPQSQTEMNEQFLVVAKELGAEKGDGEYYRGIFKHAPFLFKMTSANPPGFMVKLCRIGVITPKSGPVTRVPRKPYRDWHDKLPSEYSEAGIRCEIDGDYVFIWIDQPQNLAADAISSLISAYVKDHPQYFPESDTYCFECRKTGSASLVQVSSSIATICQECLDRKRQLNLTENERLNPSDSKLYALLPLAILSGGFGWAAFWAGYDEVFRIASTDKIWLPFIVIGLIILLVGFALGWPVGRILHRSGAVKLLECGWLSFFATLCIVVLGELIYTAYFIYSSTGVLDLLLIGHAALPSALGKDAHYVPYRFIFAVAVAGGIYEFSKLKVKKFNL